MGQGSTHCHSFGNSGHLANLVVDMLRNIHRNITAITLGPAFLPQVTGNFGNLLNFISQRGTAFKYRFHLLLF